MKAPTGGSAVQSPAQHLQGVDREALVEAIAAGVVEGLRRFATDPEQLRAVAVAAEAVDAS